MNPLPKLLEPAITRTSSYSKKICTYNFYFLTSTSLIVLSSIDKSAAIPWVAEAVIMIPPVEGIPKLEIEKSVEHAFRTNDWSEGEFMASGDTSIACSLLTQYINYLSHRRINSGIKIFVSARMIFCFIWLFDSQPQKQRFLWLRTKGGDRRSWC